MAFLSRRAFLASAGATALLRGANAQGESKPAPRLTRAEKAQFLKTAKVVNSRPAPGGITGTMRITLTDGALTHDASFQAIDESKPRFETPQGTELNFRDSWKFNVAAYLLDEALGLHMIPVTVERRLPKATGSLTWWVDDVLATELDRRKKKLAPTDRFNWTAQYQIVMVFDQLIDNFDRNLGNLVIDKEWRIWMIDHTRAFRWRVTLSNPKVLTQCDRELLAGLKRLDAGMVGLLSPYLNERERTGLLQRRDRIVAHFEQKGPESLYDFGRRTA